MAYCTVTVNKDRFTVQYHDKQPKDWNPVKECKKLLANKKLQPEGLELNNRQRIQSIITTMESIRDPLVNALNQNRKISIKNPDIQVKKINQLISKAYLIKEKEKVEDETKGNENDITPRTTRPRQKMPEVEFIYPGAASTLNLRGQQTLPPQFSDKDGGISSIAALLRNEKSGIVTERGEALIRLITQYTEIDETVVKEMLIRMGDAWLTLASQIKGPGLPDFLENLLQHEDYAHCITAIHDVKNDATENNTAKSTAFEDRRNALVNALIKQTGKSESGISGLLKNIDKEQFKFLLSLKTIDKEGHVPDFLLNLIPQDIQKYPSLAALSVAPLVIEFLQRIDPDAFIQISSEKLTDAICNPNYQPQNQVETLFKKILHPLFNYHQKNIIHITQNPVASVGLHTMPPKQLKSMKLFRFSAIAAKAVPQKKAIVKKLIEEAFKELEKEDSFIPGTFLRTEFKQEDVSQLNQDILYLLKAVILSALKKHKVKHYLSPIIKFVSAMIDFSEGLQKLAEKWPGLEGKEKRRTKLLDKFLKNTRKNIQECIEELIKVIQIDIKEIKKDPVESKIFYLLFDTIREFKWDEDSYDFSGQLFQKLVLKFFDKLLSSEKPKSIEASSSSTGWIKPRRSTVRQENSHEASSSSSAGWIRARRPTIQGNSKETALI